MIGNMGKYKPEYCGMLIAHAKEKGGSFESFAAKIGVSRQLMHDWAKAHSDFKHAKDIAKGIQEKYFDDLGVKGMSGKLPAFHQTAWIFYMKARFGWNDAGPQDQEPADLEFDYE